MKKLIALVLALVMALSLTTVAWGATTHEVSTEAQLAELLDEDGTNDVAEGDTIKLLNNIQVQNPMHTSGTSTNGVSYTGGKSFTIDFNNCSVSAGSSITNAIFRIKTSGTVTLMNGTITASDVYYGVLANGTGTINLDNMTISLTNTGGQGVAVNAYAGTVNVNDGTEITATGAYAGMEVSGTANIYEGSTVSYVGNVPAPNTYGSIGSAVGTSGGTLNIYGGELVSTATGGNTVATNSSGGTINITGGTITGETAVFALTDSYYNNPAEINISGGTINGALAETAYGTASTEVVVKGGTFTADVSAYVAPGYVFANGSVVNNAGNFVGSSSALTSSTATYGATLADALANKTHTVEVKAALEASASLKSFQTYQVFVTKLADKTVSVLPNQYIVVPTDVNADVVVVDGSKIIFLAQVAGVTKYDDNAEAVKVAYNAKPACDDVYVASAADAGVYYLYKNAYYVECDAVSADKVFNVDGVAVAAKATNLVKTLAHTYAFDTKTVGTKTEVTKVYCTVCKDSFSFVVGDLADAVKAFGAGNYADTGLNDANGDDIFVRTASGLVYVPVTPSTDKVTSAETFDAGIAMYVGMSVMAAAGSAVVLKKKD